MGQTIVEGCLFVGYDIYTPFNFENSIGENLIHAKGFCPTGGATAFGGTVHEEDEVFYLQAGTAINYRKPRPYLIFADDAAAETGGVPLGGLYKKGSTGALTVRTT